LRDSFSVILASKTGMVGLAIVLFWILVAIFAPLLTPYSPTEQDYLAQNQPPSRSHILGTDSLGRDIWSRLIYGARVVLVMLPVSEKLWLPLGVAIWGVAIGLVVGSTLGLMGGYLGGFVDEVVMRLLDAMMAFPVILLYMIIIAAVGASATNVVLAIAI
jgi:peptide/nickel transport system permease protein